MQFTCRFCNILAFSRRIVVRFRFINILRFFLFYYYKSAKVLDLIIMCIIMGITIIFFNVWIFI